MNIPYASDLDTPRKEPRKRCPACNALTAPADLKRTRFYRAACGPCADAIERAGLDFRHELLDKAHETASLWYPDDAAAEGATKFVGALRDVVTVSDDLAADIMHRDGWHAISRILETMKVATDAGDRYLVNSKRRCASCGGDIPRRDGVCESCVVFGDLEGAERRQENEIISSAVERRYTDEDEGDTE